MRLGHYGKWQQWCQYINFKRYAGNKLEDLYSYIDRDLDNDAAWKNFEDFLGDFSFEYFYDDHCLNTKAESWGEAAGVADDISNMADEFVTNIQENFRDWLDSIEQELDEVQPRLRLDHDANFLSFNYTSTLIKAYNIKLSQIKFIHGSVEFGPDLIFGHGENIEIEPELDKNGDSNRHMYSDAKAAAKSPFFALKKNVEEIIRDESDYFISLKYIDQVIVIGHSLNFIDMPYFSNINNIANSPLWNVCYYSPDEELQHKERLIKYGINKSKINMINIADELSSLYLWINSCHHFNR